PVRAKTLGRKEPPQDLDRVEDRRRGRLDRDPIARAQEFEVERGEQRQRRRRARLMPSDALRRGIRAPAVGVVDRVDGEPQEPVLDAEEEPALLVGEPRAQIRGRHGPLCYPGRRYHRRTAPSHPQAAGEEGAVTMADAREPDAPPGIRRGLTNYGDPEF